MGISQTKTKTIEFLESRRFSMEQTDDNFEIRVTHSSIGVGAKRNICRIRRIRSNITIGQSHEDYLRLGSLNTENAAAVIISSNKFRIGKAAYKINMRSFRYVRQ